MKEEFIPYDLALRMNRLGFDDPCIAWFVSESYGLEIGKVIKSDLIKDGILAPTWQSAFRWLFARLGIEFGTIPLNEGYRLLFINELIIKLE